MGTSSGTQAVGMTAISRARTPASLFIQTLSWHVKDGRKMYVF
jgi:hypothetical protein